MRQRLPAFLLSILLLLSAPAALAEEMELRTLTDAQLTRLAQDIVLEQQRRSMEGLGYMASGFLGRYFIGLKSAEVREADDVRKLVLTYDFSHEVEEPRVFLWAITTRAFQDGVALDTAFLFDHAGTANSLKELQKGATLEVAEAFELTSTSPVELEISETFSFSDEVIKVTIPVT